MDCLKVVGLHPDGIIGHSVGELGCAYADKSFTVEEVIKAAYWRGRGIENCAVFFQMLLFLVDRRKNLETAEKCWKMSENGGKHEPEILENESRKMLENAGKCSKTRVQKFQIMSKNASFAT